MFHLSRTGGGLAGLILGVALITTPSAPGQTALIREGTRDYGRQAHNSGNIGIHTVTLPTDPAARKKLEAARDYLQSRSWPEAVRMLQSLLDAPKDTLVRGPEAEKGAESAARWSSLRADAEHTLAHAPPEALAFYRLSHEANARKMLLDARQHGDIRGLTEILRRYRFTRAGGEALDLVASYHLDRGQFDLAASCFQRLLDGPDDTLPPLTLFKAALAFRAAGERGRSEILWKRLATQARDGLPLGGRLLPLDDLHRELQRWPIQPAHSADWTVYRGNASRNAIASADTPVLEPRLQRQLSSTEDGRLWLRQGIKERGEGLPPLPQLAPLGVAGKLIYRSHAGIHALDPATGRELWHTPSPLSLDGLIADPNRKPQLTRWLRMYQDARSLLFRNSVLGTLSSDGRLVYAVEDLAIPPHPLHFQEMQAGKKHYFSTLKDAIYHNRLRALDLTTGRVVWEAGGHGELAQGYFLGPPLPLAGQLYAVVEKQQELVLVCLDGRGEVVWTQALAASSGPMVLDPGRRLQALPLAFREGVLVCATNAGAVLGIDPLSRSLLWAYTYPRVQVADEPDDQPAGFRAEGLARQMQYCTPISAEGRVVVAAPDSDAICCLELATGRCLWQTPRQEMDVYVAGIFGGKVLVVGAHVCRALSLEQGKVVWQHATGEPSGQGVAAGNLYYLPLREGCLLALDLENPAQSARIACRAGSAPGNLLFHEGDLWSQDGLSLTAFPQLRGRLVRVEETLARNPQDAGALLERGRLRLDRGEIHAAVLDLRQVLERTDLRSLTLPARRVYFDALTQLLQRDFAAGEKYLEEYRALCSSSGDAGERRTRQIRYLTLLARGREGQGRRAEALQTYRQVLETARGGGLLPLPEEPALRVQPELWVRRQVVGLLQRASAEQRQTLVQEIQREALRLQASGDVVALGALAGLLAEVDGQPGTRLAEVAVWRAERLVETRQRGQMLAAELQLLGLEESIREPGQRARLLLARGRLLIAAGQLQDAADTGQRLGRDFASVVIHDGRTGADLLEDMRTDKRLLPYLEKTRAAWEGRPLRVTEIRGRQTMPLLLPDALDCRADDPFGQVPGQTAVPAPPSGRNLQLVLEPLDAHLRLQTRDTQTELVRAPLTLQLPAAAAAGCGSFRMLGHLCLVSVEGQVVALDAIDRRVLWSRNLVREAGIRPPLMTIPNPLGGVSLQSPDGRMLRRLGLVGPAAATAVYLLTARGLEAVDPISGETRWLRSDVSPFTDGFGDNSHLFLVESSSEELLLQRSSLRSLRCFRSSDGVAVAIPDGIDSYRQHVRSLGRCLLVAQEDEQQKRTLRFYDTLTGKDLWRQTFPAETRVLESLRTPVQGMLAPDGGVTLIDLAALQEGRPAPALPQLRVQPAHMKKAQSGYLLCDAERWYVALHGDKDPDLKIMDGPNPTFNGELNGVPIAGWLYAFDRGDGGLRWYSKLACQGLLLNRFEKLPVILCAAAFTRQDGAANPDGAIHAVRCIDKRTGKLCYNREMADTELFTQLLLDSRSGVVELSHPRLKLRVAPR